MEELLCDVLEHVGLWNGTSDQLRTIIETDMSSVMVEGVMIEKKVAHIIDAVDGFKSDEDLELYLSLQD